MSKKRPRKLKLEYLNFSANIGDWIVRGIKGELYPVRDDIFCETYEPVEGDG